MSPDRSALRIPEQCPYCGSFARITLETTVKADTVLLTWCCGACNHDWAVVGHDELQLPHTPNRMLTNKDASNADVQRRAVIVVIWLDTCVVNRYGAREF